MDQKLVSRRGETLIFGKVSVSSRRNGRAEPMCERGGSGGVSGWGLGGQNGRPVEARRSFLKNKGGRRPRAGWGVYINR